MLKIATLFFAGIALCQFSPTLPELKWAGLLAVLTIFLICIKKTRLLAWVALGLLWSWMVALNILHGTLDSVLEGKTLVIEGNIDGLPERTEQRLRFDFQVSRLLLDGEAIHSSPKKIRLSWYYPKAVLLPDEQWRLQVRLKRPHGWRNPGGFDYEGWLFRQRINATGYVVKGEANERIRQSPRVSVDNFRRRLADKVMELLSDRAYGGVVQALLVGERSGLSQQYWNTLVNTGTIHLMAISGLHIGIIFGWFYFMGRWGWVISHRLPLIIPAQKIGLIVGVSGAFFYALLAGFSIPTQRAFLMVVVAAVFFMSSRKVSAWAPLFATLFLVFLYDPLSILSPGFWLSFWAVAIIFSFVHRHKQYQTDNSGRKKRWQQWIWIQLGLLVGLAPLLFYFFGKVSLIAPLANLLAVPWVGLIILPLIFIGVVLLPLSEVLATVCLQWAEANIAWLSLYLQGLEHSPIALWNVFEPPLWSIVCAMLGVSLIFFNQRWGWKGAGGALLLPMVFISPAALPEKTFQVSVLDIGQGLSVVVHTRHRTLVYDTGPYYSPRFNAVENALIPYLLAGGHHTIDRLVIGHADKDHSGGVGLLSKHLIVGDVIGSHIQPFTEIFPAIRHCLAGQTWQWDGVNFDILAPPDNRGQDNDASCVLRISTAAYSVLIAGDIEKNTEQWLLETYGKTLESNALIAPHHGSMTSSTVPFIAAVNPEVVVFSTGYRNRFGFPKETVVQRYKNKGSRLYNTAYDGAVIIFSGEKGAVITRHREQEKHYWNGDE